MDGKKNQFKAKSVSLLHFGDQLGQFKVCYRIIRCIFSTNISQVRSHDKSFSLGFVLFKTLVVEMSVPFSGLTKIVLFEDFVQYLLDCLKRTGWEIGSPLPNCPNAALVPLWLRRRRQVVQKGVFSEQHPPLQRRKGPLVTVHSRTVSTALRRRLS